MANQHQVIVEELKLYGYHGIHEEERKHGTFFQYDLSVQTEFSLGMESDELRDTLNYVELIEIIKEANAVPAKLLEYLGGKISRAIFEAHPRAKEIRLKIQKLNPPIGEELKSVGVLIEESRESLNK